MKVNLPNVHETGTRTSVHQPVIDIEEEVQAVKRPVLVAHQGLGVPSWRADAARASLGLDLDHDSEDSLLLTSSINA